MGLRRKRRANEDGSGDPNEQYLYVACPRPVAAPATLPVAFDENDILF
jgi:hypothetical protein